MFTVIRGRKSANIDYKLHLQNADVLDLLAKNGVVCTPESAKDISINRLMNVLKQFKSFDVIFIHPALLQKSFRTEFPSEQYLPEYTLGNGEILAVIFRYLCLNYFGYKGIYTDAYKEYEYLF